MFYLIKTRKEKSFCENDVGRCMVVESHKRSWCNALYGLSRAAR